MTFAEFKNRFSVQLNEQQSEAAQSVDGPVLLLAVPGSGKTTVLVTRLGYMIYGRGIDPRNILTMTYTVSATKDMAERFAGMFGDELVNQLQFRTINAVAYSIVRYYSRVLNRPAFQLVEESRATAILRDIYREVMLEFPTESNIKEMKTTISFIKNMMLTEEEIRELKLDSEVPYAKVYRKYREVLRENNLMDFDDQLLYAHTILQRYPEILEAFQRQYPYLCVDEAQDTSKIQHEIIHLLVGEQKNLFMVGDEDQSIYGFRAAYPQALLEFEQQYPGAKVLLMEENFRSVPEIVSVADAFVAKNAERHQKTMVTARAHGRQVMELPLHYRNQQYKHLERIATSCLKEAGTTAVLYRNNESAIPLMDLFDRHGIPYQVRQMDTTFFTHPVVLDLVAMLKLCLDQTNEEAFMRVYYKFGAGISRVLAEEACKVSRRSGISIWDALVDANDISNYVLMKVKSLRTHFNNMRLETTEQGLYRIIHFMGYGEYLEDRQYDENKTFVLQMLARNEKDMEAFLIRLEVLEELVRSGHSNGLLSPEQHPLILSTIHSAKGLEYDRVYLLDVVDGVLPLTPGDSLQFASNQVVGSHAKFNVKRSSDALQPGNSYEEDRRLFYVAMTRAKEELNIFTYGDYQSAFTDEVFHRATKK